MTQASPKRRFMIAKNLIMMLVFAVLIVLAVFSWFTSSSKATANGISIKSRTGGIDIAPCIKTYNDDNSVKTDGPGVFTDVLTVNNVYAFSKDCTGDGMNFIIPEFNVTNDFISAKKTGKEVNVNQQASNANIYNVVDAENGKLSGDEDTVYHVIQYEFYVRSKDANLNLGPESVMSSRTESDGHSLTATTSYEKKGDTIDKKSAYGTFNVDGLVGAMRVSLSAQACSQINQTWENSTLVTTGAGAPTHDIFENTVPEKQILWLPRPELFLDVKENTDSIDDWELRVVSNSDDESSDGYRSYHNTYYQTNENGGVTLVKDSDTKTKVSTGQTGGIVSLGDTVPITQFSYDVTPVDEVVVNGANVNVKEPYYVTKMTLNIWIEGTDAEARRAMDGGEFDLVLSFV